MSYQELYYSVLERNFDKASIILESIKNFDPEIGVFLSKRLDNRDNAAFGVAITMLYGYCEVESLGTLIARIIELAVANGRSLDSIIDKNLFDAALYNEHIDLLLSIAKNAGDDKLQDLNLKGTLLNRNREVHKVSRALFERGLRVEKIWRILFDGDSIWNLTPEMALAIINLGEPYDDVIREIFSFPDPDCENKKILHKIFTVNYPEFPSDNVYYPDYEEYLSERKKKLIDDYKEENPIFLTLPKELQYQIVIKV